jgi:hypothetical protein
MSQAHFIKWRHAAYTSRAEPIIVGGCPRSGTTLARVILDTHPNICCGPESRLFTHNLDEKHRRALARRFDVPIERIEAQIDESPSLASFIDAFFADYCTDRGKRRWAEKTPRNVLHLGYIFKHFPRAKFVHVIRDGRDVAASMRRFSRQRFEDGKVVVREEGRRKPIKKYIRRWVRMTRKGLAVSGAVSTFGLRYEDLVQDPEPTLRKLFEFLGEAWEPAVLEHHKVEDASRDATRFPRSALANQPIFKSSLGKWRQELDDEDVQVVKKQAGTLLRALGYVKDDDWA